MQIINIVTKLKDTHSDKLFKKLNSEFSKIKAIKTIDSFLFNKSFSETEINKIGGILSNSISQEFFINQIPQQLKFDYLIRLSFLPGVTDNLANVIQTTIEEFFKIKFSKNESVHSSKLIFIEGILSEQELQELKTKLGNSLINKIEHINFEDFQKTGDFTFNPPLVKILKTPQTDTINILEMTNQELEELGKKGIKNNDGTFRGPLSLSLEYLQTIKEYFQKLQRNPHDIELEAIAQTWSEHCKHTIFASPIDDLKEGLYKGYIKRATQEIRQQKGEKDICVSVFSDNAGGIIFDENWIITDKAETHNSPSALDPFGGAITGIVGVNRDTIGFGKGAKPIINKYGFCVGLPEEKEKIYRDPELKNPALSSRTILEGIISGVNEGGNCSGISTPQGFVYFDDSYRGKPLVFVGNIGLIPREINNQPSWEKNAQPGDHIVVIGGKVGRDGIHGATFSSEELDQGSPSTAVQIGDPFTQKKLSDAIIKEARDLNLFNSITDNGAGGISCSVAEMARECNGCTVELDKVPTKYPNLSPWEIWISESQERITLAIPPEKYQKFQEIMSKHEVESTIIGTFNNSGKCIVNYNNQTIVDLDLEFLHNGIPITPLQTNYQKTPDTPLTLKEPENLTTELLQLLTSPNIASFKFISQQYDHNVQGGSIIQPLQGKGEVNTNTTITNPLISISAEASQKAIICSQGYNPSYSDFDTFHMAAGAIDTAIRNIISAGGPLTHLALMDNFCWCSSNEPYRLGQLKEAVRACYEYAIAYQTPYISGKDSMFNDFKGYDENGKAIKISALPTLLISSIAVIDDYTKSISIEPKLPGDLIYILGLTKPELAGSEYLRLKKNSSGTVPKVDAHNNLKLYQLFTDATEKRLISSSLSPQFGGIATTLAKKAIASGLGMDLNLTNTPTSNNLTRLDELLFSESHGRFIVSIAPKNQEKFEKHFQEIPFAKIGTTTENNNFTITFNNQKIINTTIQELSTSYHHSILK